MATYARDIKSIQTIVGAYVDGIYGPQTTLKVKEYQTKIKTYVDGIWGPATEKAHLAYVAAQQPTPTVDSAVVKAAFEATLKANARGLNSIFAIVGHTGTLFDAAAYSKVVAYQKLLTTVADGIWGLVTEIAYQHRLAENAAVNNGLSTALVPVVEVARYARAAGFSGTKLVDAVSVAIAESGVYMSKTGKWYCDPIARFVNTGSPRSADRGVWQINDYYHPDVSDFEADNPKQAAVEVWRISYQGTKWSPWATWNSGTALKRRPAAQAAVDELLASTSP